ncbi:uncharacterized protein LOC118180349, partial [Stegodyphus dumicola]|uniref:uncharacterized protein LOC118180349 n=1 Tax=Stegodyphus dumicola TaxID=202533 RepID=UPI0015B19547
TELCAYPFQPLNLNIYGRQYVPARLCCAFGDDDGLTYSFSGTSVAAQPWTPTLQQIKNEVEALTHEKYNYVLLNKYPDGEAKISAHRDAESALDPSCSIPTLSYGSTREMHFMRENYMTHILSLEHGSLLVMKTPTNTVWKHSIPTQPEVKTTRISLTFRKILLPQGKRSCVEMDFNHYGGIINSVTPKPCMNKKIFPRKKARLEDEIRQDDWLSRHANSCLSSKMFRCASNDETLLKLDSLPKNMFHLGGDIFVTVSCFIGLTRVHVRKYVTDENDLLHPTKDGVSLSPLVWKEFCDHANTFAFFEDSESVSIVKNDVCVSKQNVKGEIIISLQRLFQRKDFRLEFVPEHVLLRKEHLLKLDSKYSEICAVLKETPPPLISKALNYFVRKQLVADIHFEREYAGDPDRPNGFHELQDSLCKCIEKFISNKITEHFVCFGCQVGYNNQLGHECLSTSRAQKCENYFDQALFTVNWTDIAKDFILQNKSNINFSNLIVTDDFFDVINVNDVLTNVQSLYVGEEIDLF